MWSGENYNVCQLISAGKFRIIQSQPRTISLLDLVNSACF